jgi:hypothetical protein
MLGSIATSSVGEVCNPGNPRREGRQSRHQEGGAQRSPTPNIRDKAHPVLRAGCTSRRGGDAPARGSSRRSRHTGLWSQ